ncbi:MAG: type II toxin-antitoxin system RelE/ParE family toxin [Ignavibacteriae bacterium]|nr:type II toxin-antitoxin system RelE/ParE family toxin [Ignavibacteriota bacterium]
MVRWTIPAKSDLKGVHDYITGDSSYYAQKVTDDILDLSETLRLFPQRGRVVPEVGNSTIRELFIYSYRLIYQIKQDDVFILALIHCARDISDLDIQSLKQ